MKMKKEFLYMIAGIVFVALMAYMTEEMGDLPFALIVILLAFCFGAVYLLDLFVFSISSVADLEKRVMIKMNDEGYQCKKDEGVLEYTMNGRVYDSYFWHIDKNFFRTMIVDSAKIDEDWDKISAEGKSVLANYVNNECNHTTFIANGNGCVCTHTTYVRNPSDFLNEAKNAYEVIGRAFNTAVDILPQIKEKYPLVENESSVGFVRREKKVDSETIR